MNARGVGWLWSVDVPFVICMLCDEGICCCNRLCLQVKHVLFIYSNDSRHKTHTY
jgi:hypothetical protein